jgi:TRAP-type C4-dicarboxylate transport system substrate-binding protein
VIARVAFFLLVCGAARAEPLTWRMATVAPEGSSWANALRGFAREVEQSTASRVRIKLYPNAVAGDEEEMTQRMLRGQLDAVASGGVTCQTLVPSMRVLAMPALFQSHDEAKFVMNALNATLQKEARESGFVLLGVASIGVEVLLARRQLANWDELRALKTWRWGSDDLGAEMSAAMGLQVVRSSLTDAAGLYDKGKVDGYWAIPSTALIFQWSLHAHYLHLIENSFRVGCLLVSARAADGLGAEDRQRLLAAAAHLTDRFEEAMLKTDGALLGGGFQHQGVKVVKVSDAFRAQFFAASVEARDRIGAKLVPKPLMDRVLGLLSDFRAEHREPGR